MTTQTDTPSPRLIVIAIFVAIAALSGCLTTRTAPLGEMRFFGTLGSDPDRAPGQVRLGIQVAVVDVRWASLEPKPNSFDLRYLHGVRERLNDLRAAGSLVCLDLAMQDPPAWVFAIPHSRFVNQHGQEYRDETPGHDVANGIFNQRIREAQEQHVRNVFGLVGSEFFAIRMGWGENGALCYPRARFGGSTNSFWAFDAVAQGEVPELRAKGLAPCPVPGWKPGTKSAGHKDSRAFADWYIGALVDYQNWQLRVVRRHFAGPLQMMYPPWGLRPGALDRLVAADLNTDTQEVQRGLDYERLVRSLRDRNVIVYCAGLDSDTPEVDDDRPYPALWSPMRHLAHLAHTQVPRLETWGGNAVFPGDLRAMELCFRRIQRFDVRGLVWANEHNLYERGGQYASIHDYARLVRALPPLGFEAPAENGTHPAASTELAAVAEEAEFLLRDELRRFYPASVDAGIGGFLPEFHADWTRGERESKHIVAQSCLTWTAAEVARRRPDLAREYAAYSTHGLRFLRSTMWDAKHGGFHWCLDETGSLSKHGGDEKHAYGTALGIQAAANVYRTTRDPAALALAVEGYGWLEDHAYDKVNHGYFEALGRDGTPILAPREKGALTDRMGTPYGRKSANVQLHILEALSELYQTWPDPQLRGRLEEMLGIVRDRIVQRPGTLYLEFTEDWRPLPGPASYGRDLEAARLMIEVTTSLGMPDDRRTLNVATMLVDHALKHGFDWDRGGFFDEGPYGALPSNPRKVWWAQAEGVNTLLLLHERSGNSDSRYLQAFWKHWDFVLRRVIDPEHGGWLAVVTREGEPLDDAILGSNKGADTKVAFHSCRAMLNLADRVRRLGASVVEDKSTALPAGSPGGPRGTVGQE